MGWKGTLRSFEATGRRIERENARRQREHEKYLNLKEKEYAADQARQAVEDYNDHIQKLTTVHKNVVTPIDWQEVLNRTPPLVPMKDTSGEKNARYLVENYRAGFFVRIFRLVNWQLRRLNLRLEEACRLDELDFKEKQIIYEKSISIYNFDLGLAQKITSGDLESFAKALVVYKACADLDGKVDISFSDTKSAQVLVSLQSIDIVPLFTRTLLKSNKVSEKEMAPAKRNAIYFDYICSNALRSARDMFSILPMDVLYISVESDLLDSSSGLIEKKTILSMKVPRNNLNRLNFDLVDPSDALKNFIHNVDFKAGVGFKEVDTLDAA